MGQSHSTESARAAAASGWPAYMSQARLKRAMLRFRADRSVLGTRVRLRQSGGGWVEYSRLPGGRVGQQPLYRRSDSGPGGPFPSHLAGWELPGGEDVPHEVRRLAPDRVALRDKGGGEAEYSLVGGTWTRIGGPAQKKVWPPW